MTLSMLVIRLSSNTLSNQNTTSIIVLSNIYTKELPCEICSKQIVFCTFIHQHFFSRFWLVIFFFHFVLKSFRT